MSRSISVFVVFSEQTQGTLQLIQACEPPQFALGGMAVKMTSFSELVICSHQRIQLEVGA